MAYKGRSPEEIDDLVTFGELSDFLNRDQGTIGHWEKIEVIPRRGQDGVVSLRAAVLGLIAYYQESYEQKESKKSLNDTLIALNEAKVSKINQDMEFKLGKYVELQQVEGLFSRIITRCRTSFLQIPTGLAPLLATIADPKAIETILQERIYEALNQLSNREGDDKLQTKGNPTEQSE